jgi:hypothetical protein
MASTTLPILKSLIESACHKRNLSPSKDFRSMGFSPEDMLRVNQVVFDRYRHHAEVYPIDSIQDIVRIINNDF